jgi:hypothetical protein
MSNKAFVDSGNLKMHHHIYSGDHPCLCEVCNKTFIHNCVPIRYILSYYKDPISFDIWKSFVVVHCIQNHHSLQMWFLSLSREFKKIFVVFALM